MNKHLSALKSPKVKELVLRKFSAGPDLKRGGKNLLGAGATIVDEALFGLPGKNEKVKGYIEEYKKGNPNRHKVAKVIGFLGGGVVPGGIGVKALSKVGKLSKLLKGGGLKQAMSQGAVYGGSYDVAKGLADKQDISDIAFKAAGSGALGAMLGGTGKVLAAAARKIKPIKSPRQEARQKIDEIGKGLYDKLTKRDINKIKEIVANPVESKHINFNTLLHRGTENTKAVADALYQLSPAVREMIGRQKEQLIKGQMPHIRDTIIQVNGTGFRPSVEEYVGLLTKKGQEKAAPLYEEAYKAGTIDIPEILAGNKQFKKAHREALSNVNEANKGKAGYEPNSVRVLDDTKKYLWDAITKFKKHEETQNLRQATEAINGLVEKLDKATPIYKQARKSAEEYLKIREAGKAAKNFRDKPAEELEKTLQAMTGHEKYGYKTGVLQELLEKAEDKAGRSNFGNFGRDITNRETAQLLEKIVGKQKAEKLIKNIDVQEKAIENFKGFTEGSATSKHESNKGLVLNSIGALKAAPKSMINLAWRLADKSAKKSLSKKAKTQTRFLLNPRRLLKYETNKIKKRGSGYPWAVGVGMRATDD